jgi:hypothetical protein
MTGAQILGGATITSPCGGSMAGHRDDTRPRTYDDAERGK